MNPEEHKNGLFKYYYLKPSNITIFGTDNTKLPTYPVSDFIKELDNQTTSNVRTITSEQAQSIINIACNTWKSKLAKQWSTDIVLSNDIDITEEFYQEIRKACTKEQNELFDKIFGKDEPKYKIGDWVTRIKENFGPHKNGRTLSIKEFDGKLSFYANEDDDYVSHLLSSVRKATPEEIEKAQYYPDGTPCLVRDYTHDGWEFRYANGNGEFYTNGKKSGSSTTWKYHMKLDVNDLPVVD